MFRSISALNFNEYNETRCNQTEPTGSVRRSSAPSRSDHDDWPVFLPGDLKEGQSEEGEGKKT